MTVWKRCIHWILVATLLLATSVLAQERLLSFHSHILINADASLLVTETIRFHAEGHEIRKGLYRDFPTRYRDRLGNNYQVRFDVMDVRQDGQQVWWKQEQRNNGVRIVIGDTFLKVPGDYEYTLIYRTSRQLGFFEDHDELYWNVTGMGWSFVIEKASARVELPQPVPEGQLLMEGYTGAMRERGQDYESTVAEGSGEIRTTRPLPPRSGLTLVLSWPKGVVQQPSRIERTADILQDNSGLLWALLVLLANAVYLGAAWSKVGRDLPPGVIFPHYEPPVGITPALARYVSRMRYDAKALTAAIVNLAVQGHLHISQKGKQYTLQRRSSTTPLLSEEELLVQLLFKQEDSVALSNKNHAVIGSAQAQHRRQLKAVADGKYVLGNGLYLLPSLFGSIVAYALIVAFTQPLPLMAFIAMLIVLLHILFAFLLKAPTREGRQLLDKLDGFRLYLDVAEKEEMNLRNPPELTPEIFERYLPYAIALGVEQHWAERFASKLASLHGNAQALAWSPLWYSGPFNAAHIGDFSRSLGSSFNNAIAAAAVPPGTSSGAHGGGFSGGGGGGGGGGGH